MLQNESEVIIADNTGAKRGQIFSIIKGSSAKKATIGDVVNIAIKDASSGSTLKKGETSWAVIVRTKKETRRKDGTYIRFDDNAVALINKDKEALGKRIFWPVARELREKGFKDIASLAEEVL